MSLARWPLGLVATALVATALVACATGGVPGARDAARVGLADGGRPSGDAGRGTDGGRVDAGSVTCSSAAECDDGLACNGVERCEGSRCVGGAPMVCDDGVPCTSDACVEPGTCAYTPDSSRCAPGQTCIVTGCTGGGGSCSESPCRLLPAQCGCPSGQACYLGGTTRSCQTPGVAGEGAACSDAMRCAAGLDCVDMSSVMGRPTPMCLRYCGSDADCTGPGSICFWELGDGTGGSAGATVCTRSCDPVSNTGCPSGTMCLPLQEAAGAMRFFTQCIGPAGTRPSWSTCTADTDCSPGHGCVDRTCYRWCRVGGGGVECGAFESCVPVTPAVMIGSVRYGVCA